MSLVLHPYQNDLYDRIREAAAEHSAVLVQLPTGGGKTVVAAKILKSAKDKGAVAWFNVHRIELVEQAVTTLTEAADISVGITAAGFRGNRHEAIQVNSIQTLRHRRGLLPDPDLIVWDEAHHIAAGSWGAIFNAYPNALHVGLSATPQRLDGAGLDGFFKKLVVGPSVADLIAGGFLSDYVLYNKSGKLDLSGVHTLGGDYNKKEVADVMSHSAVVGDAIEHYKRFAMGKRSVCFMWSVNASKEMAEKFKAEGIPAAHLDGDTPKLERKQIVDDFRSGRIHVLTNVEIVTEGFDLPALEAVFLLRPTQSLALYLQMVGRALRKFPGKEKALIFDHAGNCLRHFLPDTERHWTLEGQRRKRGGDAQCPIKQCPRCYAMLPMSSMLCKWCGFKWQIQAREMEVVEGELKEVDKEAVRKQQGAEVSNAKTFEQLVVVGQQRGYGNAESWARHILDQRAKKHEGYIDARKRLSDDARNAVMYDKLAKAAPKDWI